MRSSTTTTRTGARTRLAAITVATAVVMAGIVGIAAPASATTYKSTVKAGTTIQVNDAVTSANGQFRLVMQGDGNLVEYGIGNVVLWASNTATSPGAVATVGKDGALVLHRGNTIIKQWGKAGAAKDFGVRADGELRMRTTSNGLLWRVTTFQDRISSGAAIAPGTVLRSNAAAARSFTMQTDGNLVQYVSGKATWSSQTFGNPGAYAALQPDGNFVVYSADGRRALWASNTSGKGRAQLLVQLDSNVVLYGSADTRVWSTRAVTGLRWPVKSTRITGRYGDDRGPGHTPRYHQGTDAGVGTGTPVYSSGRGTVTTVVRDNASYGNYVVVTYGLTTVLTAHLSEIEVTKGQMVSVGKEIAKSGNTGQSTGPHVHVETRVNGALQDPLTVLHFR
ncbi:peptidoglycan DD-metalloendopeptidase family protein [Curtobacterium sp. MMLR14_010]|uniref:peptidoglycan DD-metalloendopeptidase family protein n=1 Tax=Curtobacterium sp. MMLR14_010 TaxID=1898743 RepID=UPI0009F59F57|nr:peptidoglycan DD-metalloendopeptidase family protein [Curtobacterium sp. MMLR14_010]